MPSDFDGDGKTDLAILRNETLWGAPARFWILRSSTGTGTNIAFGISGYDKPVTADYDGDGKDDLGVSRGFYPVNRAYNWSVLQSSNGVLKTTRFGLATDSLVPADYDGDKKADIAVWRASDGFWYRINSLDNSFASIQFGQMGDKPVPADYDGDGKTDVAVYRDGIWYLLQSRDGFAAHQFGQYNDNPIPYAFVR